MIQKAIDRILDLAPIETIEIDSRVYSKDMLREITPPEFVSPTPLTLNTLSGMADYINTMAGDHEKVFLKINNYNSVSLLGQIQPENSNTRFVYAQADLKTEQFSFSRPVSPNWYDLENFVIALQSQFVQTQKIDELISHLSHLANETVVDVKDDSFSQSYQIKTGITTKSQVVVTNPITLQPHRTFSEIVQPESTCIFRLKSKGGMQCALFISDGGAWKLDAITNIKEWLQEQLPGIGIIA